MEGEPDAMLARSNPSAPAGPWAMHMLAGARLAQEQP